MPRIDLEQQSMARGLGGPTNDVEAEPGPRWLGGDASLGAWLATPESAQRWWAAAAVGARAERPVGDDWPVGQMEERTGVTLTIADARGSDPVGDHVAAVTRARSADEEPWDAVGRTQPAAHDTLAQIDPAPWRGRQGQDAGVAEVTMEGLGAANRGAAVETAWAMSEWTRMGTIALMDDDPMEWAADAGRAQDTLDERLSVLEHGSGGGDQAPIIVNVTGVDEAEIADIAVAHYEAAQAKRRFRAHVPG